MATIPIPIIDPLEAVVSAEHRAKLRRRRSPNGEREAAATTRPLPARPPRGAVCFSALLASPVRLMVRPLQTNSAAAECERGVSVASRARVARRLLALVAAAVTRMDLERAGDPTLLWPMTAPWRAVMTDFVLLQGESNGRRGLAAERRQSCCRLANTAFSSEAPH